MTEINHENMTEKPIPPTKSLESSRPFAIEIAQLAHDRHCTDITILELGHRSPVANHFVICTGTSAQQIRSVASEISTMGKNSEFPVFSKAGMQQGRWAVVDFVDVVVHLFDDEFRKFYDLELLWGDAPRVDWQNPA
jgi:ribosome-associated protein